MGYPAWTDIVTVLLLGALFFVGMYFVVQFSKRLQRMMKERVTAALQKRRNTKDPFRSKYGYSWDYVIVFKIFEDKENVNDYQIKFNMKHILGQLTDGGLEIRLFYSYSRKEVYCKVRASLSRLLKEADRIDLKMPLDPVELRKICSEGREGFWEPLKIPDSSPQTSYAPYDYLYYKFIYDSETDAGRPDVDKVYKRWPVYVFREKSERSISYSVEDTHSPMISVDSVSSKIVSYDAEPEIHMSYFRASDRLKLISSIIANKCVGGCNLDMAKLLRKGAILGFFPLHDNVELRSLEEKWLVIFQMPWKQEINMVKDYFGEKIGLYFHWLAHYTTWLFPVSVLGVLTWIWIAADNNNPDAPTVPYFAGIMALWSSLFLEFWKRKEKYTAMHWGMVGYEEEEQVRPQFTGEMAKSPVDGQPYLYFSRWERTKRSFLSLLSIYSFILLVIGVIAAIFTVRIVMEQSNANVNGQNVGSVVSSILIAIQIQVMNAVYGDIALKLNNNENHRTDTEYEDSLIAKTFLFQFVNSFSSLFYIAFVKPFLVTIDPCPNNNCMVSLQTTLGTIFLTRLAVGNLTELGVPLVTSWLEASKRDKVVDANQLTDDREDLIKKQDLSEVERAFVKPVYDVMLGTFEDYSEMVIQFGYTTMFIAAFPLATIMSFINNYVELRVDAWKLCQLCRRPEPRSCEDIGTWYVILEVIAGAAVFTNSALVAFTGGSVVNDTWVLRVWIFALMSAGLFGIRMIVAAIIPDVPTEVDIQLARNEFITGKVFDNIEDDDDNFITASGLVPNYIVRQGDEDPL